MSEPMTAAKIAAMHRSGMVFDVYALLDSHEALRALLRQREEELLIACSDFQSACQRAESYAAQFAAMTTERDAYDHALHSLTAGGSEFAHDVKACVQYVRDRQRQQLESILRFKKERDEAKQQLAAARARCANLKDVLQALYDVQNGCPLPKYEKDWHIAMERAQLYLTTTDRPPKETP